MGITIKFNNNIHKEFADTLKHRANEFFTDNNYSKSGGNRIIIKSIILISVYLGSYVLIMTNLFNVYQMWILAAIMGFAAAGIGMGTMHDANHSSFSDNKNINKIVGYSMELLGGNTLNWKIQHNNLHHTYTNIENADDDISSRALYRFTKGAKYKKTHRFQFIYMFFFYGLMTFTWLFVADFFQLRRYYKEGYFTKNMNFGKELTKLILFKILYFGYMIVLPLLFLDITWWQYLIGLFTMQYILGFILAITFQLAHLVEKTDFPNPENSQINENWFVHQLNTTADFAQKNKLLTWYIGGLNFQVEHHLFPRTSHIHYPKLAKIVKQTCSEFNIRYNVYKTTSEALASHIRMLKKLGQKA